MKNKKIILYAVVITAILICCAVSAIGSNEKMIIDDEPNWNLFRVRLIIYERTYGDLYRGSGCNRIYDVNRDGVINFQDAGLCWVYTTSPEMHDLHGDLLYDVNMDGNVNFQDAGLIWINRD